MDARDRVAIREAGPQRPGPAANLIIKTVGATGRGFRSLANHQLRIDAPVANDGDGVDGLPGDLMCSFPLNPLHGVNGSAHLIE